MRRYLLIAAVVILLLGVGVIIYFLFLAKKPVVTTTPGVGLPIAGQGTSQTGIPEGGGTIVSPNTPTTVSPRLVRISVGPVALGESVVNKTVSTSSTPETTVNYIDRESGNIFSYSTASRATTRTSNKTIPGIQSASWLPERLTCFLCAISPETILPLSTPMHSLLVVPEVSFYLKILLTSPCPRRAFLLLPLESMVQLVHSRMLTAHIELKYSLHPYLQFMLLSPGKISISFIQNHHLSSWATPISLIVLASFLRIFGPRMGLTALASPSGKWVLVSYSLNGSMQMGLVNTTTNEVLSLPIPTITDKCVWSADDSVIYCGVPLEFPFGSIPR